MCIRDRLYFLFLISYRLYELSYLIQPIQFPYELNNLFCGNHNLAFFCEYL